MVNASGRVNLNPVTLPGGIHQGQFAYGGIHNWTEIDHRMRVAWIG